MVRDCAASLLAALKGVDAKLIVILDGCGEEYASLFPGAEIVRTDSIGNQATFAMQMDVLCAADSEFVYFSEDDYIYRADAFSAMLRFMSEGAGVHFVTPLDHPDRYNGSVCEPRTAEIRISGHCHWREVGTSCLTFMTRPETLRRCRRAFLTYVRGEQDSVAWLGVTKFGLFSFSVLVRSAWSLMCRLCGRKVWFGRFIPLMAWWRHNVRLLWSPRFRLWSPIPSLAQHLCSASLAPFAKFTPQRGET